MINKISLAIMIGFLPNASEVGPAIRAPKNAPSKANETANSLSSVVISGH